MDISSMRDPAAPDLASFSATDATGLAEAASAGSAPLSGDAITTSPLTFFGGVVQQIGQAMVNDAMSGSSGSADASNATGANAGGLDQAIGLLEGVIGLMSAYGGDPSMGMPDLTQIASAGPPTDAS